jgi:hypothetical protein
VFEILNFNSASKQANKGKKTSSILVKRPEIEIVSVILPSFKKPTCLLIKIVSFNTNNTVGYTIKENKKGFSRLTIPQNQSWFFNFLHYLLLNIIVLQLVAILLHIFVRACYQREIHQNLTIKRATFVLAEKLPKSTNKLVLMSQRFQWNFLSFCKFEFPVILSKVPDFSP